LKDEVAGFLLGALLAAGAITSPAQTIGMALVEGGKFRIGNTFGDGGEIEEPVHEVSVSTFYLARTEVTFEQYDRFCVQTGRGKPKDDGRGRGTRPVTNVSWLDAAEFCNWLSQAEGLAPFYTVSGLQAEMSWQTNGYRLPTEAEWEYAARGGNQNRGTRYAGGGEPDSLGWDNRNSDRGPHQVGEKQANELGLYDMSGNVWEWCNDWLGEYPAEMQRDPRGAASGDFRVLRGGSWSQDPRSLRTSERYGYAPESRSDDVGFRPARPAR
jgi:formylglycine-generating enzyme required for sulfatase activity